MSPPTRKILIAVISIIALAGLAGVGTAAQDDLVQLNSDGTVHIIDAQWSSTEVSEGQSFEFVITIQNTGKNTETGQFSFLQSGGSGASVTFAPETINYELEPGERKRYRIEVMGDRNGITSSQILDLSIDTNGDGLPDQPADGVYKQITVYPSSATIGGGTINPSGERQSISKTFTQFKDNSSGILGGYDSNIPPVTSTSDGFEDNSQGRVFNFLRMSNNNNRPAIVETGTSGEARIGFAIRNVPDAEHYTVQLNYLFQDSNFTEAEVKVVDSNGVEIDKRTSYYINDTGQRETRYFTLTDKESQHLRQNKTLYVVVDSKGTSTTTGERLSIFYGQLLSDDNYIKTTQNNILVDDMVTTTPTKWQNFNSDTQTLSDIQVDEYETEDTIVVANKVHNYGNSVGTKQLVLYENGQITDQKEVTVNPGETIYTVYTMSKSESGIYVFEPSGGDSAATAVVSTDETIPPVARISETDDYHNGKLMADPLSSDSIHLDGSNSFAPTGDIVSYEWDLEWTTNRTGSEVFPTVSSQGTYQIVLTVEDSNGLTDTASETLYSGTTDPTAKTLTDTTVEVDESVPFDASNSSHEDPYRTIDSYQWDFADGTTGSGETIDHSFSDPGTYDVQLTVTDDLGNTDTDTRTIEVAPPQAHADITVSPNEDLVGREFSFDASNSFSEGDSTIESYTWNFGDGTTETTTSATNTHTYSSTGDYTAEVVVENNYGETDSAVVSVSVIEAPFDIGIDGPTTADTSTDITVNNDPTEGRDNVDTWTWEIEGQGTYKDQDSVTFNYDEAGTYDVTLTGYNKEYDYTDSETLTIDVSTSDPVAKLSSSYETEMYISDQATFDATDSYDPDGTTLDFTMYLSNDNEQFNTDYKKDYLYPYPGTHTSTVVVTDEFGNKDKAEITVDVINRGPVFDATLKDSSDGSTHDITGGEEIAVYENNDVTMDFSDSYHREPRGELTYEWDDGTTTHTSSTSSITTQWDTPGTYSNTALVKDQWGATDGESFTVVVEATQPVADVQGPNSAYTGETITLDPSGSYVTDDAAEIVEYAWDFDNGITRTTTTADTQDITYDNAGTYDVTLTVTDSNGRTDTTTHTVDVDKTNPVAVINAPNSASVDDTVTFDGSDSYVENDASTIQSYDWDFGDGSTATGDIVDYSYSDTGTYTVTLTVTDEYGNTDSSTHDIDITRGTTVIGETGEIGVSAGSADDWNTLYFNNTYDNPVVIMEPLSYDGGNPAHMRLANVSGGSVDYKIEEWDYLDGPHTSETVHYVVIEAGAWEMSDGTKIEAGKVSANDHWSDVNLTNFSSTPTVFTTPQTYNGGDPIVTRNRYVSSGGFDTRVQEEEANGAHTTENVGYIAFSQGTGQTENGINFEAYSLCNCFTDHWREINFNNSYGTYRTIVLDQQTEDGGDTAGLRYRYFYSGQIDVKVEEEKSYDTETGHTDEEVGYLIFDSSGNIEALQNTKEQVRKEEVYSSSQVPQPIDHDSNGATIKGDEAWDPDCCNYSTEAQYLQYYYDPQPTSITWEFDLTYTTFTNGNTAGDRGNRPTIQVQNSGGTTIFQIWRNTGDLYFLEEPGGYQDIRDNYVDIGNISTDNPKRIKIAYNEFGNSEYRIYLDGNYVITVGDNRTTNSMNDPPYEFQFGGRDVTGYDGDAKTTFNVDYISNTFNEYEP